MTKTEIDKTLRQLRAMLYSTDPRRAPSIWAAIVRLEAEQDGRPTSAA